MAFPIKQDYRDGALALIRGRVINALARVCSWWACGNYINVHKPEYPTGEDPIVWDLDVKAAAPAIAHEFYAQDLWDKDYPLALDVSLNAAHTAVAYVRIHLPSGCVRINGKTWTFDGAKFTNGSNGWYRLYNFATGDVWLVEKADAANVLTFQTSAPADGDMGFYVGSVAFSSTSGVATIRQNMIGGIVHGKGDNAKRTDMVGTSSGAVSACHSGFVWGQWDANTRDTMTWERGVSTVTDNGQTYKSGLRVLLPSRMVDDGLDAKVQFREFEFDQHGCLKAVGAEETDYGSVTSSEDNN